MLLCFFEFSYSLLDDPNPVSQSAVEMPYLFLIIVLNRFSR